MATVYVVVTCLGQNSNADTVKNLTALAEAMGGKVAEGSGVGTVDAVFRTRFLADHFCDLTIEVQNIVDGVEDSWVELKGDGEDLPPAEFGGLLFSTENADC